MIEIMIYVFAFGLTGLFIFLLLRYGPVEQGILTITDQELTDIKALHESFWRDKKSRPQPKGNPLYKRKMVSHNGMQIFSNGIMAKFCVGKKGKYRFVPFNNIIGIYPVEFKNPMAQTDSFMMGQASWKGLQVETADYMVSIIDSRAHDFQRIVPLLKRGLGDRWDSLYRESEAITGELIGGQFYRHRYLRGEPEEPQPEPLPGDVKVMAPAEPLEGYGELLAQESPQDLEARAGSMLKGFVILFVVGIGMLAPAILFINTLSSFLLMFLFIMGITMTILSLALLVARKNSEPVRIYENGILQPYLVGKGKMFIPYGRILSVKETSNFIDGEIIVMKTRDNQTLGLRKSSPEIMAQMDMIKSKISNPLFDFKPGDDVQPGYGGKLGIFIILLAPVLSLFLSLFLASNLDSGWGLMGYVYSLVLVWPGFTFIFLTFILLRFRKSARIFGRRPDFKLPTAIVISLLLLFIIGQAAMYGMAFSDPTFDIVAYNEPAPASSVLASPFYENTFLHINGTVFIGPGETLEIRNTTLSFHGNQHKDSSLWAAPGSMLVLDNCTLESTTNATYSFEVYGRLRMNNTSVSGVWGDTDRVNHDGGLEIYSPDAVISRCTIGPARTNGLMFINSTAIVSHTEIFGADDDGIEVRNSTLGARNMTVRDCGWAMVIDMDSNISITGSEVEDNAFGISAAHSSMTITDTKFTGNLDYAVKYDDMSHVHIADNQFSSNGVDVEEPEGGGTLLLCNAMTLITGAVCMLAVIYSHKATDNS